ncbi:MAG: hypothetical protein HGA90_04760, partial [Alphaproteobacteria bacterium]|nr:hypothetical protein [Alphaproteobacteria bacterium]
MKQHGFQMQIKRLFTTKIGNPCDSKFFDSWSREACEAFAPAFHSAAPESFSIVEENTLPSWLWRHRASSATRVAETNPRQVIERIAGAATYAGWKKGLWSDETNASAFHDEVCALLARRLVALDPYQIGAVGLDWAYGFEAAPSKAKAAKVEGSDSLALPNATIDAILSGSDTEARARWQKYLADTKRNRLTLQFTDTENEWRSHVAPTSAPRLAVNLLAFRSEDGRIDVAALRHAVRLSVILMELHYEQLAPAGDERRALSLGIDNLAAALAAMALPYDSVAGRATAAALSAIVSAESAIASAHLAQAL